MKIKKCTKCGKIKKISEFHKQNDRQSRRSWCKSCECIFARKRYYKNWEKNIERKHNPKPKYGEYKKGARKRNLEWNLSFEEFMTFWQKPCSYCGAEIKTIGLDRIDNNKGYNINNIIPCCYTCNWMKRDFNKKEFINHCKKVVGHNK